MGFLRNVTVLALCGLFVVGITNLERSETLYSGKPLKSWFTDLNGSDYNARSAASEAIIDIGAPAVPMLRQMLHASSSTLRNHGSSLSEKVGLRFHAPDAVESRLRAATLLAELGPAARPAFPDLIAALGDEECRVADEAARTLIRLRPHSIPALFKGTEDETPAIRLRCIRALAEVDPDSPQLAATLKRVIEDSAGEVRAEAARVLGEIGHSPTMQANLLSRALQDKDAVVRIASAKSLARLGSVAVELAPSVAAALQDPEPAVRVHAAKALWMMTGATEPALACLIEALGHKGVGWEAAYILGEMGPAAAPAVPQLIASLKTERVPRPFRAAPSSAFALGRIGAASVGPLMETLGHSREWIRCSAALALGFVGESASGATPMLRQLLDDKSADVRNAALLGLVRIGVNDESLVPPLTEMLRAEDILLRSMAVASLRRIAPDRDWEALPE